MQTVYRERAHGTWEYWTYCDLQRTPISQKTADQLVNEGERLVTCKAEFLAGWKRSCI